MARGGRGGGGGRSHGGRSHGARSHGFGHHHGIGRHHGFGRRQFGRSHGFGCHSSFRNHYHGRIGGGGTITFGGMALMFDTVSTNPMPPKLTNGTYSFAGNQMAAIANMETFPTFYAAQL